MHDRRVTFRISDKAFAELQEMSRDSGESESSLIRTAVEKLVAERPQRRPSKGTALELARKTGILGAIKGLPADLSANPAHMKGFGE